MRVSAKKLNHAQFFKACEALKKNRQWFLDNRPINADAATKLGELTGLTIAISTMADIREACGVKWTPLFTRNGTNSWNSYSAIRDLTTAVKNLYVQLGGDVPQSIQSLMAHFRGKPEDQSEGTQENTNAGQ